MAALAGKDSTEPEAAAESGGRSLWLANDGARVAVRYADNAGLQENRAADPLDAGGDAFALPGEARHPGDAAPRAAFDARADGWTSGQQRRNH